ADAPTRHAWDVAYWRRRVGPGKRIRRCDGPVTSPVRGGEAYEVFEVHLRGDPGIRRGDGLVAERILSTSAERAALLVRRDLQRRAGAKAVHSRHENVLAKISSYHTGCRHFCSFWYSG